MQSAALQVHTALSLRTEHNTQKNPSEETIIRSIYGVGALGGEVDASTDSRCYLTWRPQYQSKSCVASTSSALMKSRDMHRNVCFLKDTHVTTTNYPLIAMNGPPRSASTVLGIDQTTYIGSATFNSTWLSLRVSQ